MAKRKLTKQQQSRIAKRRNRLTRAASDANVHGPDQPGVVISRYGAQADIEATGGDVIRCHLRANLGDLVAGDRVIWRGDTDTGVVQAIAPRTSLLQRPDSFGKLKPVAANISQAVVTIAPEPTAHANLIDRYLVAAETMGIEALLLVNKRDLVAESDPLQALCQRYRDLGYATLMVSARNGVGLPELQHHLREHTTVFVGQSGVGKSSVIQALLPQENIKIGDLSQQVKKGKHTTTYARLYHFPFGGDCIDSPGIREFGLWHLQEADVAAGFREFRPFLNRCRFRNCRHLDEPGCALIAAVSQGEINPDRHQSYCQVLSSLDAVKVQSS